MKNAASAVGKLPPLGPGEFRFITNAMTGEQARDGRRRFRAVASSTITDQAGNTISLKALQQMREDFRNGLTIFMDHDYSNVVDKVFGTSDAAEIVQTNARDERTGQPIYDLIVEGGVNEPNPRAIQLHDSIAGGYVKFGASIGAIIREHKRDKETGGYLIDGISAKEMSIVGIPKNQRSWAYKASLAAADLDTDEHLADDDEDEDEPAETQVVAASGEPLQQWVITTTSATGSGATTGDHIIVTNSDDLSGESKPVEAETPADPAPEPEESTESAGDEETTPGGQEADAATPETAPTGADEPTDPAVEQQAGFTDAEDVAALVAHAKTLVEEIGRLRVENARLTDELATVQASVNRLSEVEKDATEAIQKVMALPLSRKAVGHVEDFTARYPGLDPRVSAYVARKAAQERS